MELHLKIIGILLIALAAVHVIFPRYFKWKHEFARISLINREMIYVHTFFIAIVVFMMGVLCVSSSAELTTTPLGRRISLGLGVFWFLRLLTQFFGYSSANWKGKSFETIVHVLFSSLWIYMSAVFLMVYWG